MKKLRSANLRFYLLLHIKNGLDLILVALLQEIIEEDFTDRASFDAWCHLQY